MVSGVEIMRFQSNIRHTPGTLIITTWRVYAYFTCALVYLFSSVCVNVYIRRYVITSILNPGNGFILYFFTCSGRRYTTSLRPSYHRISSQWVMLFLYILVYNTYTYFYLFFFFGTKFYIILYRHKDPSCLKGSSDEHIIRQVSIYIYAGIAISSTSYTYILDIRVDLVFVRIRTNLFYGSPHNPYLSTGNQ